ncbi:MAG: hypothetical protein ACXAB2_12475, partial [Candidatus Hodarchaeales archaeon]
MNKKLYLLGAVTIGLLLLGSLSPAVAQGEGPFIPEGTLDIGYDISLTNNWLVGPTPGPTPTDLTNTNLKYTVTSMKSPLDQFFNVGFFTPGDPTTEGPPIPEFKIDGSFVGSELFVKIVNDQSSGLDRLIDWQAVLTVGNDINLSVMWPEGIPEPVNTLIGMLPETYTLPAGSGTPPLPVVSSTANFSSFENLNEMATNFGYEGLPFVSPAIFFVEDTTDAYDYWSSEVDLDKLFPPAEDPQNNNSVTVTPIDYGTAFELLIEAQFFNQTHDHGSITINGTWDAATGYLTDFEVILFADLDENGSLDAPEEFSIALALTDTPSAVTPISIGDSGEYIMNVDFWASIVTGNATEDAFFNDMLTAISDSITELNGRVLLNYTVDAMDGLYYHLDGYMLNLTKFIGDRLGTLFGGTGPTAGFGAQEPLPTIDTYYHPISGMDEGRNKWAINMFDAQVYSNMTMFYETYDGYNYQY